MLKHTLAAIHQAAPEVRARGGVICGKLEEVQQLTHTTPASGKEPANQRTVAMPLFRGLEDI